MTNENRSFERVKNTMPHLMDKHEEEPKVLTTNNFFTENLQDYRQKNSTSHVRPSSSTENVQFKNYTDNATVLKTKKPNNG